MHSSSLADLTAHFSVQISYSQLFLTLPSNEITVSSMRHLSAELLRLPRVGVQSRQRRRHARDHARSRPVTTSSWLRRFAYALSPSQAPRARGRGLRSRS